MGKSYKTRVIEMIFFERWDPVAQALREAAVSQRDVAKSIDAYNKESGESHSTRNLANFIKDVVRNRGSFNSIWPRSVFEGGYTGQPRVGEGFVFEFLPVRPDQLEPFPYDDIPPLADTDAAHVIESISLPPQSRRLGRNDESWLTQIATRLRLIETHFAVASKLNITHIDHLQMNVKLGRSEVDSLYLAIETTAAKTIREIIVVCEAKGRRDDILVPQIVGQVRAVFALKKIDQAVVVPIAIKTVGKSLVQLVEFEPVAREQAEDLRVVIPAVNALYRFHPPVEGVR